VVELHDIGRWVLQWGASAARANWVAPSNPNAVRAKESSDFIAGRKTDCIWARKLDLVERVVPNALERRKPRTDFKRVGDNALHH